MRRLRAKRLHRLTLADLEAHVGPVDGVDGRRRERRHRCGGVEVRVWDEEQAEWQSIESRQRR